MKGLIEEEFRFIPIDPELKKLYFDLNYKDISSIQLDLAYSLGCNTQDIGVTILSIEYTRPNEKERENEITTYLAYKHNVPLGNIIKTRRI